MTDRRRRRRVEAALPGYQVLGVLGSGGFGVVYEARHRRLERHTAIKVLVQPGGGETGGAEFAAEARLLARLRHPHIVEIFDYVEADDLCMIIMEMCAGGTLRARAANGLPVADTVGFGLAIAAALDEAHRHQVIHRDIKPDNILFTSSGDGTGTSAGAGAPGTRGTPGTLKVTDFGVAKLAAGTTGGAGPHTIVGTPAYMAPEQFTGTVLSPATDLYALGAVLHELLTGRRPSSPGAGAMPPAIGAVVRHALNSDPVARPASALDLALALARAAVRDLGSGWLRTCSAPLHVPDAVRTAATTAAAAAATVPAAATIPAPEATAPAGSSRGSWWPRRPRPELRAEPGRPRGSSRDRPHGSSRVPATSSETSGVVHLAVDGPLGLAVVAGPGGAGSSGAGSSGAGSSGAGSGGAGSGGVGSGGMLYVSQPLLHRVVCVDTAADPVVPILVAGSGRGGHSGDGGPATAADLDSPAGLSVASDGALLIADHFNDRIRRVAPDGTITTVSASLPLRRPRAVTVAADGALLIADTDGHRVWRLAPDGSTAEVLAGTGSPGFSGDGGPARHAAIGRPAALAVDRQGRLFLADPEHRRVRCVEPDGRIRTFAGTSYGGRPAAEGAAAASTDIGTPTGVALAGDGTVYLADPSGHRVLAIRVDGTVRVVAGGPSPVPVRDPRQVAAGPDGRLFIAQPGQRRITVIAPTSLDA